MTDVTSTPPALRWIALFLAACAVLGLFLGFRDQIRKNPPGWYTGAEQIATPLVSSPDGAREAVPFDPNAPRPPVATGVPVAPAAKATETLTDAPTEAPATETPAQKTVAPPVSAPTLAPKPKAAPSAPKAAAPSGDPVGDILEGQKQTETPAAVPY